MSAEVAKPVEEVVAPVPAVEAPAVEATPAPAVESAEPAVEAPATTEAAQEEVAAPVKEEVKPVEEGTLGYKGPGLLKSFIFQKKFFWFGTEPVEAKSLNSYLRGEKAQEAANKNVAWASSTGNGLLFFSKKATDKASPAGIFNLSEVSDIAEDGTVDFSFVSGGHKHTFQASTVAERDNWVAVLKTKVEEAKVLATTVPESEEYKKTHSGLVPAIVTAASPKKSEEKKEEKAESKEEKKEEKAEEKSEAKEEKKEEKKGELKAEKTRKSRSASRKRNSIFGGFGIGKKEEKVETPKEETPVTAAEEAVVAEPVEAAAVPETTETAPVVEPVTTEAAPVTPVTPVEARPTPNKRSSIFGNLKQQFSGTKEKKPVAEAAPVVPVKDAEPVSDNAPVIPAVEASEPLETSSAAPATLPAEATEAPAAADEVKVVEPEKIKSDKRKSSLPWLNKKDKSATTSDEETEKPKSPFAKLRATVKGKSNKTEKAVEKPVETVEETPAAETTPAATEPTVEKPEPVVPATTAQVTASA